MAASPCVTSGQEERDYEDEKITAAEAAKRYVKLDVFGRKEARLNVVSMDSVTTSVLDMSQESLIPFYIIDLAHNGAHAGVESERVITAQ